MPNWRIHRVWGTSNPINRLLDKPPSKLLSHAQWRKLTHRPEAVLLIGLLLGHQEAQEATKHLLLDFLYSRLKK